jgi:glycosyltransferase involved in cell wall biosynthesis
MSTDGTLSVVVVTYEWPEALDVVLRALCEQEDANLEVVVADDGSGSETARVVELRARASGLRFVHVRQRDDGFRRARILDLAARESSGEYLVFIDGDSIPRRGFLRAVRRAALPGWFLASKRLHLSSGLSKRVLEHHVPVWRWSALHWLLLHPRELLTSDREAARPGLLLPLRDRRRPWRGDDEFTPPYDAFGFCFGVWREDFERVGGFDLRFTGWGGEDGDIAARLRRLGLRCGWPGPAATMLHLWHPVQEAPIANRELLWSTLASDHVEAVEGLHDLVDEPGDSVRRFERGDVATGAPRYSVDG